MGSIFRPTSDAGLASRRPSATSVFDTEPSPWTVGSMNTTIELPDVMFRQVKALACRHGLAVSSNG